MWWPDLKVLTLLPPTCTTSPPPSFTFPKLCFPELFYYVHRCFFCMCLRIHARQQRSEEGIMWMWVLWESRQYYNLWAISLTPFLSIFYWTSSSIHEYFTFPVPEVRSVCSCSWVLCGSWGAKQALMVEQQALYHLSHHLSDTYWANQGLTDRKFIRPPHKHCQNLLRKIHVYICVWHKNGIEENVFFKGLREKKHSKGTDKAYWSTELTMFMQQILERRKC